MPDTETTAARYDVEQAALDAEMEANRADYARVTEQFRALRVREENLTDRRVQEITDDELRADPELRRWLARQGWSYSSAARRLEALDARPGSVVSKSGYDGRDECRFLLVACVTMEHDTDIPQAVTDLRRWIELWGLGRDVVPVSVFESTLSAGGSYYIHVSLEGVPEARLTKTTYGRDSEITAGTLAEVLAYVARHHPYTSARSESDWDDDY